MSLLHSTAPHQQLLIFVAPLCRICSPSLLPAQNAFHLDVERTRPLSASDARLCAPPHVTVSITLSCIFSSPICHPWPVPWLLSSPGRFACRGSLHLPCVSTSPYLCVTLTPDIFWFLVSPYQVDVFAQGWGAREPLLPGSPLPRSSPHRATWPWQNHDLILIGWRRWGVALEVIITTAWCCHGQGPLTCKTKDLIPIY